MNTLDAVDSLARKQWSTKEDLLCGGSDVDALIYQRASQDRDDFEKSVDAQEDENRSELDRRSWSERDSYTDNDRGASRHSHKRGKRREDFERLVADIKNGIGDVLIICELTRQSRELGEYAKLRDLCRDNGLRYWLVGGRLYDLYDENDLFMLGIQSLQAEHETDRMSRRIKRGVNASARKGRPSGKKAFGYRRVYDADTGNLLAQVPDDEPRTYTGPRGEWVGSPAAAVAEMFSRFAAGTGIRALADWLDGVGVPPPQSGPRWTFKSIRNILSRDQYRGARIHHGEIVCEGTWKAIVDDELFYTVQEQLTETSRRFSRPSKRANPHLLAGHTRCGVCGDRVFHGSQGKEQGRMYRCRWGCVRVKTEFLEAYVLRVITEELSSGRWQRVLETDEHPQTLELRGQAQRLRARLAEWEEAANQGDIGPREYRERTDEIRRNLTAIDNRLRRASSPHSLAELVDVDDPAEVFLSMTTQQQRHIIGSMASVRLLENPVKGRPFTPERVAIDWVYALDTAA